MFKWLPVFGQLVFKYSSKSKIKMTDLEKLKRVSAEITKSISDIKYELTELEKLAATKVKSLQEENDNLRNLIEKYKRELIRLEIANGIGQVELTSAIQIKPELKVQHQQYDGNETKIDPNRSEVPGDSHKAPKGKPNKNEGKSKENKPNKEGDTNKKKGDKVQMEVVDIGRLDIRIGKILDVKKHPEADKLYVNQVDVGTGKTMTVVSGLVMHVTLEELLGRTVVVLCNMKPVNMRGIASEGMLLCAVVDDKLEVLNPPQGSCSGDLVQVDGYTRNPDPVLNPKKKVFEKVAIDLSTNQDKEVCYKGSVWTVAGKGPVTVSSLIGANIK